MEQRNLERKEPIESLTSGKTKSQQTGFGRANFPGEILRKWYFLTLA